MCSGGSTNRGHVLPMPPAISLRACVMVGRLTEAMYAYKKMQLSQFLQSPVVGRLFLWAIQIKKCFVLLSRTLARATWCFPSLSSSSSFHVNTILIGMNRLMFDGRLLTHFIHRFAPVVHVSTRAKIKLSYESALETPLQKP